jgi:hypothetical protein
MVHFAYALWPHVVGLAILPAIADQSAPISWAAIGAALGGVAMLYGRELLAAIMRRLIRRIDAPQSPLVPGADILAAINAARGAQGIAPLRLDVMLSAAAASYAALMASADVLSHTLDGPLLERAAACGYQAAKIGECIAWNAASAAQCVDLWLRSPPHRVIVLDAGMMDGGAATMRDAKGEPFWCFIGGKRQ